MGSYYDTIPNFRYWDVNAWKDYLKEYVVPIHETTAILLELRDELLPYVGKSLKAVKDNDERLLPFFVGGINENGDYKERSLEKLIKLMFGIYVEPREFVSIMKSVGEEGFETIIINDEEEENVCFLRLIKTLKILTEEILENVGVNITEFEIRNRERIEKIINNPREILELLKQLYGAIVKFNAHTNPYTFFIMSTSGVHWRYLREAYPKLSENFENIGEFLGLKELFVPDTRSGKIKREYTIWGHAPEGIADSLYKMQITLWLFFDFSKQSMFIETEESKKLRHYISTTSLKPREAYLLLTSTKNPKIEPPIIREILSYVVPEPENLLEHYKKNTQEALLQMKTNVPKGLERLGMYDVKYIIDVEGIKVVRYQNEYSPNYYKHVDEKPNVSLIELLDWLGPRLFLNVDKIIPTHLHLFYYPNFLNNFHELYTELMGGVVQ